MGAIFFYVFVYFIAYYSTYVVNLLSVRPLIRNRYIAGLVPVVLVAISHGYFIVTSPPPPDVDMTVESALMSNIFMPIAIVFIGVIYFMWKEKDDAENLREKEEEEDDDDDLNDDKASDEKVSTDDKVSDSKDSDEDQVSDNKISSDKKESKDS